MALLELKECLKSHHTTFWKSTIQNISLMFPSWFDCSSMVESSEDQHLIPTRIKAHSSLAILLCLCSAATPWKCNWIILLQSLLLKTNANVIFHFEFRSSPLMQCHEIAAWRLTVEFPSDRTAFSTVLFHPKNSSVHFVNIQNGIYFWEFPNLEHNGSFFFKTSNLKSLKALPVTNWNASAT